MAVTTQRFPRLRRKFSFVKAPPTPTFHQEENQCYQQQISTHTTFLAMNFLCSCSSLLPTVSALELRDALSSAYPQVHKPVAKVVAELPRQTVAPRVHFLPGNPACTENHAISTETYAFSPVNRPLVTLIHRPSDTEIKRL